MWKPLRKSRNFYSTGHMLHGIECRCLSFDIGIHREDDLIDHGICNNPLKERIIVEFIRSDSLYRRDDTTEYMISTTIYSGPLYREHIEIIFYDTESMSISFFITTDTAYWRVRFRHTMAESTFRYIFMEI